jgi:hypothetical protein
MKKSFMLLAGLSLAAGASVATAFSQNPCNQCRQELYSCIASGETSYSCYDNYVDCLIGNGCMVD